MAATGGPLGQRKVGIVLPRLTRNAVVPIGNFLSNESCSERDYQDVEMCREKFKKTSESTFLTGMALCRLWEYGQSSKIPSNLYDMNFMSADVSPMECIENFLRAKGFDEPVQEIFDRAIENETIALTPPPVPGTYRLQDISAEEFRERYPNVEQNRRDHGRINKWAIADKNQEIGEAISYNIKDGVFDWDLIIWAMAYQLSQHHARDMIGRELMMNQERSSYLYNDLDQNVSNLFSQRAFMDYFGFHHIVSA